MGLQDTDLELGVSAARRVVGIANEKGTGKDGKPFDRTYRFTNTWMDRGENWQRIASQVTLVGQR